MDVSRWAMEMVVIVWPYVTSKESSVASGPKTPDLCESKLCLQAGNRPVGPVLAVLATLKFETEP